MALAIHSQQLFSVLKRQQPAPDIALLNSVFEFTLANGGWEEAHFTRVEDASYNPRPARLALILIGDACQIETATLTSGMLLSIAAEQGSNSSTLSAAPFPALRSELAAKLGNSQPQQQVLHHAEQLLALAQLNASELIDRLAQADGNQLQELIPACAMACALRLDLARHFHLASPKLRSEIEVVFLQQTKQYAVLAQSSAKCYPSMAPLANLLGHWLARHQARSQGNLRTGAGSEANKKQVNSN